MKKMALMKAMSSTESSTMSPSDGGFYKVKQKIKSNKNQREIKRAMEEKEKSNAAKFPSDKTDEIPSNVPSNRSSNKSSNKSSNVSPEAGKYSHPIRYKFSKFKKEVKGKIEDVGAEMKKKSMIRKQNRAAAGGEGGFTVGNCGPGGCKMGEIQPGTGAAKTAWMRKN